MYERTISEAPQDDESCEAPDSPSGGTRVMADGIVKTLQVKVKSGQGWLRSAAREVNQVWNFCNEASYRALKPFAGKPKALSGFDLDSLTAGATHHFQKIGAGAISEATKSYAQKRRAAKRSRLKWRVTNGPKRSLGWVPFRGDNIRIIDGAIVFCGHRFRVFDSYGLDQYDLRGGSFAENSLGEWFFNVAVKVQQDTPEIQRPAIGIDLGLKTTATCSSGLTLEAGRFYRGIEPKLAQAQRRGHKRQAKRLHLSAKNRRKDALHKFSSLLVRENGCIYIGDVSSSKLAKTRMAKSVLDSGWGMLRDMILSKSHRAGIVCEVVDERFTTRSCADCGSLSGPKGRTGLSVREWACVDCGATHQRDINAARNILRLGLQPPLSGTLAATATIKATRAESINALQGKESAP